jgi:nitrate reductase NapAB chaperone NapD
MLNLLPKDQKNKIVREYRIRFWVVTCSLFLAVEIISLVLLFPPYLTVQTRIDILNSQSTDQKVQNLTTEISSLGDVVQQTNNYLDIFNSSSTPTGVVAALQNIVSVHDKTIRIGSFYYKANKGQQQIVIIGNANSRQSLLDFTKKLKNQPGVVSADLPVSDFAKSQDINFSINVLVNPQYNI